MRAATLLLLALSIGCGKSTLTASSDLPVSVPMLTPSGALAIYPHQYGEVLPWHIETADASWQHVAPCVGVDLGAVRAFPVYLLRYTSDWQRTAGSLHLGGGTPDHIEVLGSSWDFDPRTPETRPGPAAEIARLYRHELIHLALFRRDNDPDAEHVKPEWECQQ